MTDAALAPTNRQIYKVALASIVGSVIEHSRLQIIASRLLFSNPEGINAPRGWGKFKCGAQYGIWLPECSPRLGVHYSRILVTLTAIH